VIHPSHGVQIFVATKPVDFRKGHDGLAALVQSHLKKKPFDGAVYVCMGGSTLILIDQRYDFCR